MSSVLIWCFQSSKWLQSVLLLFCFSGKAFCKITSVSKLREWSEERGEGVFYINTLRPRENGRHFADDIFKRIFMNENLWIPIKISLKFVPKGPINNIPALVQIMAWRRPGDKPLSEPMMVRLPAHICVTRPQWGKVGYVIACSSLLRYCMKYGNDC